jgi:hypothetical protein
MSLYEQLLEIRRRQGVTRSETRMSLQEKSVQLRAEKVQDMRPPIKTIHEGLNLRTAAAAAAHLRTLRCAFRRIRPFNLHPLVLHRSVGQPMLSYYNRGQCIQHTTDHTRRTMCEAPTGRRMDRAARSIDSHMTDPSSTGDRELLPPAGARAQAAPVKMMH